MDMFISCDWGTSSLRLKLVSATDLRVLASCTTDEGIASVFNLWQRNAANHPGRISFYHSILHRHIKDFEKVQSRPLDGVTLIISGMASSSLGMDELDYAQTPFPVDGSAILFKKILAADEFPYDTILVSGVRAGMEAMRGEETLLIGCEVPASEHQLFIFPGTHSKHVTVVNRMAFALKTYMTGEILKLLSTYSILSGSVQSNPAISREAFETGIIESGNSNFLNKLFSVRMNDVLEKFPPRKNYDYLSGLLVGWELRELLKEKRPIVLAGSQKLNNVYQSGLAILGIEPVQLINVEEATVRGHHRILTVAGELRQS
jgi:2-dehydro-3-deoxygalactonokinase